MQANIVAIVALVCSLNTVVQSFKCLDQNGQIDMSGVPISLPSCWPLNTTANSCNWCSRECLPVPEGSEFRFCKAGESCCQHECGTFCVQRLMSSPPTVKYCVDPAPRIACPPLETFAKCVTCEDRCRTDLDCSGIGGGGRICCPTRCGRRCHETLIF